MKGYIHSFESFGTVDGPGVRYVVFFQGCPMRCKYCHNPDTWKLSDGKTADTRDILASFLRNRSFYKTGGITATGGEPLMQIDFLTELFRRCREHEIHTCLDTSGILFDGEKKELLEKMETLLTVTDLVLLDIKHMDGKAHQELTGYSNKPVFAFAEFLMKHRIPVWIRHVAVPGITFVKEELEALGTYLKTLDNVERIEVLPYHAMAKPKYENLGIEYPLGDIPQLTKEEAKEAEAVILNAWGKQHKQPDRD